jgi:hypothetical protein
MHETSNTRFPVVEHRRDEQDVRVKGIRYSIYESEILRFSFSRYPAAFFDEHGEVKDSPR